MKNLKKVLALVLAVVMIMSVVTVASAKTYTDVKATDNYADAIDALSSLKILDGFKDGDNYSFKAEDPFTRAQAAKIVAIVHNAATNGAIKDQDAISGLYSNAQNPFVDCNSSWALPFINYCRITGLADGMTATTYEPNRYVTGVQFLKLMLTTLNFDTAKEGYTGTGWDVNVLNRANEVGLTAGLAKDWKAIAPIKRGEAAQVLYNALTKYLVEYGQLVKNNYVDSVYKTSFISNEQVAKSGYTLGGKMGITITRATDAFRRPGYNWSYGSWAAFYMDAPVNSYTTAVTMCDILKNDMKVPETKDDQVILDGSVNGKGKSTVGTKIATSDKDYGTALNYYACDGFKYTAKLGTKYAVLQHQPTKACQKIGDVGYNFFMTHEFGGQGDLTQVFKTEDGWVITTIHTFLANVERVNKNNKYSHAKGENTELSVWVKMANDEPVYDSFAPQTKTYATTDYAVGTKVLVNWSMKKSESENLGTNELTTPVVKVVTAAESKIGMLTGASDLAHAETVSIDGTKYNTNCRFVMGKDDAMNFSNWKKTYTFYFDSYGNVIGRDKNTTASAYVVMDKVWAYHTEDGDYVLKANLYDLDGKAIEKATVAAAGSFTGVTKGEPVVNVNGHYVGYMDDIATKNCKHLVNALYTYTVNDKGVYTLTWVGDAPNFGDNYFTAPNGVNVKYAGYSRLAGSYTHTAKLAYLRGWNYVDEFASEPVLNHGDVYDVYLSLSESTKFIVKSVGGEWTSYTGYTALPALSATYLDYLDTDNDGFADIVYLGNATFASDSITGWVGNWGRYNWANGYDVVTVFVDGEAVSVNVKHPANSTLNPGVYTFKMGKDADGNLFANAYYREPKYFGEVVALEKSISSDVTAIKALMGDNGNYETIGLTGVTIYNVTDNGNSVVKADANCIVEGDHILVYDWDGGNVDGVPYTVIYVIDKNIPYPVTITTP